MTRTALYRHYDADGALLYVGITSRLAIRNERHEVQSEWYSSSVRRDVAWYECRQHAAALEKVAIRFEKPLFNKSCTASAPIDTVSAPANEALAAIERHAEQFCLEVTTIGQLAVQNRRAYERIKGGTAHRSTAHSIMAWIDRDRAERSAPQVQGGAV